MQLQKLIRDRDEEVSLLKEQLDAAESKRVQAEQDFNLRCTNLQAEIQQIRAQAESEILERDMIVSHMRQELDSTKDQLKSAVVQLETAQSELEQAHQIIDCKEQLETKLRLELEEAVKNLAQGKSSIAELRSQILERHRFDELVGRFVTHLESMTCKIEQDKLILNDLRSVVEN